ncbi:MAG: hypothetical protein RLP44_04625 [Aggregatilineales bacterium]
MDINIASLIVSALALLGSGFAVFIQSKQTNKALAQDQNFARANTVIHFTNAFFDLSRQSGQALEENFKDSTWREQYWGLLSAEFYFFHHNVIPPEMFALWMSDLADAYRRYDRLWESHEAYLNQYGSLYSEMKDFFVAIHDASLEKDIYEAVKQKTINWLKGNVVNEVA